MTEPSRAAPLRSARWYWVALTVATLAIIYIAESYGPSRGLYYRTPVTSGQGTSTIVYVAGGTFTTWNWKTNDRHKFATANPQGDRGAVALDGSKVAIVANSQQSMLICDLKHPYASRTVSLPRLKTPDFASPIAFIGNGKYVVFWTMYDTGQNQSATRVIILDAETGLIADQYDSPTNTSFKLLSDETFESVVQKGDAFDIYKAEIARWRVSDEGKFTVLEEAKPGTSDFQVGILEENGMLRLMSSSQRSVSPLQRHFWSYRLYTTPQRASWLVHEINGKGERKGRRGVMDQATGRITPLDSVFVVDDYSNTQWSPFRSQGVSNENAILFIDRYGDVQVFDATTGKTIGLDAPARTQRLSFIGLSLGLAVVTALWLVAADRTPSLNWFVFALTAAATLAQRSLITSGFVVPASDPYQLNLHPWQLMVAMAAAGLAASCLIAIAWYWAWGDGLQPVRWCKGLVAWIAIVMPAEFLIRQWSWGLPPSLELIRTAGFYMVTITYGIIAMGALALVVASPRLLGFRYGPQSTEPEPTRYQVGDLVITMSGIAIVLAMVQLRVLELGVEGNQWVFFGSRASIVATATALGLVIASLWTVALMIRRPRVGTLVATIATATTIAVLVSTGTFELLDVGKWTLGDYTPYWGNAMFLAAAWIISVLPLWLLHRKGWRWARCLQPQSDHAAAPAAA